MNTINADTLQRFIFENANVRGELVRLNSSYHAVGQRHPYPLPLQRLLGEALAAAALLSATIKFTGSLILQVQGDGPVNLLVVQSNEQFHLRGLAKWQGETVPDNFIQATGKGYLAITITPEQGERYQGIVALGQENLAGCLQAYFAQSEQLPTYILLVSDAEQVVGILLQIIPSAETTGFNLFWQDVKNIAETFTAHDLLSLSNEDFLKQYFPNRDIRIFTPDPVSFRCSCTVEKMKEALRLYGYGEAKEILKTNRYVTVTCEFCHHHYDFEKADVEQIFDTDKGA